MKKSSAVFAVLCLCLSATVALGQATTLLRGTVTDPSGSAIAGAKVSIVNSGTSATRSVSTAADGSYVFSALLPGTYHLAVEAKGFKTYEEAGIILRVELPGTTDVQMKVGAAGEVVSVTSQAPLLNTTDASTGNAMESTAIEQLPLSLESTPLLLSFQPGVVYNGDKILQDSYDTRAGSVNGERSDQNNITLDGVSINDEFASYSFIGTLPTTQFSVQEFRVSTSNYDATENRSSGAQVAMVTKGGTNSFHGSLYEFNRNTVGQANDFFVKETQLSSLQPNKPTPIIWNNFGATFGGPILKDRLFFFFNYEGHRYRSPVSITQTIPSATLRDGIIQYNCGTASQCPGGSVVGASGNSYPVAAGNFAIGPTSSSAGSATGGLQQMDPLAVGPSQVALNYFSTYPLPNATNVGDGLNFVGYIFGAPTQESQNWYIGRLDYKLDHNGSHSLFFRGTGVDDRTLAPPFLPGQTPTSNSIDTSRGFVAGYTGVFSPRLVNSLRYGLTRATLSVIGDSNVPWVNMEGLSQNITRSAAVVSPTHNIAETLTWQKGTHNLQFGGNALLIHRNSFSTLDSFSSALTDPLWTSTSGWSNKNTPLNPTFACPASPCFPAVATGFESGYDQPLTALMGMTTEVNAQYNFFVNSTTSATALGQGAPLKRNWATDTYTLFFQDSWHARRNLTITYGLNYQLMTPITETSGQQVEPTINIGKWFQQRETGMLQGIPASAEAPIYFAPAGSTYGRQGFYHVQDKNFAPRFGLAWTPHSDAGWLSHLFGEDQTVVRLGFGMYYDNFGPALAMTYDQSGAAPGLSSNLSNPSGTQTAQSTPRITGMNVIPQVDNSGNPIFEPPPSSTYPVIYPLGAFDAGVGIDQSLKTPYSYAADLSIQRNLPGRMTLDVAYVGHFAHRLLAYDDIATPLNLVDTKTGIDYFTAVDRLSQLGRQGTPDSAITPASVGPTAQYWNDMLTQQSPGGSYGLCSNGGTTTSLITAVYDTFGPNCTLYNETFGLFLIDQVGFPTTPINGTSSYYNSQYSSLFVWRSLAYSNYNSLQVGLHKQANHGVLFGFNYTYSKSLDIESMAERGLRHDSSVIVNAFSPYEEYGPSEFDLRHQVNGYWVAELPFGKNKPIAGNANRGVDAIIGGWQLSGTVRWTSGFGTSAYNINNYPTNWEEPGLLNVPPGVPTGTTITQGVPSIFKQASATAAAAYNTSTANPYPGQSGERNEIRGDGYYEWDMSLAKKWNLPFREGSSLQLRWNVFNLLNTAKFDANSSQLGAATSATFGDYSQTLTEPRVMEFALVFQF